MRAPTGGKDRSGAGRARPLAHGRFNALPFRGTHVSGCPSAADPLQGVPHRQVKASRAYLAGLGTSGVLIACFLLLLMVGSAFVAFQGAPGQASNDGLDRLDVSQGSREPAMASRAPRSDGHRASDASAHRGDRSRAGVTRGARRAHIGAGPAAGAGGVEGERAAGGLAGGGAGGGAPEGSSAAAGQDAGQGSSGGGGTGKPRPPAAQQPAPGDGSTTSGPGPLSVVTGGLGGAVEDTTNGLGETVGRVAPPLQAPVQQTGQALGGVVEQTGPVLDQTVGQVNGTVNNVTRSRARHHRQAARRAVALGAAAGPLAARPTLPPPAG